MNAKSYDPRMEELPLLISYPRSGSHWVNCVLELYFNRPRLREGVSFLKNRKNRTDYMWFHDHDIYSDLTVKHNNILYLYRNPIDVVFSLYKAEGNDCVGYKKEQWIKNQIQLIKNHWKKYLINSCAKTIIKYNNLKKPNDYQEFIKAIYFMKNKNNINPLLFFSNPKHIRKLTDVLKIVTKKDIEKKQVDKKYFNKNMLKNKYNEERILFYKEYTSLFNDIFDKGKFKEFYK